MNDLYVPAFTATAVSCCILGFATVCTAFIRVITSVFTIGQKNK